MPVQRNLTGKQFGSKIKELFDIIENTPDWEYYVSNKTKDIIKTLYENKNMTDTLEQLDLKYITARSHIIRAIDRISNKRTDHLRKGKSQSAQELFELMENQNWKEGLTEKEILLAENYKHYKNFYEVGRQLNLAPSNIAITLYGSNQKCGVIEKIKKNKDKNAVN